MNAVVRFEPVVQTIHAPTRQALVREVGRAMARGELGAVNVIRPDPVRGGVCVQVQRLKPRGRNYAPVYVAGGVVMVLGTAAALGWFLVGPVTAWLAAVLPLVAGALAVRTLAGWLLRDGDCVITHTRGH